ncbi:MAG TPA: hypothetical protein VIV66_22610, partial [Pyrinomonadaceae bacterium]
GVNQVCRLSLPMWGVWKAHTVRGEMMFCRQAAHRQFQHQRKWLKVEYFRLMNVIALPVDQGSVVFPP